jgi:hypothetical protein
VGRQGHGLETGDDLSLTQTDLHLALACDAPCLTTAGARTTFTHLELSAGFERGVVIRFVPLQP